jgi:hypothetical protein
LLARIVGGEVKRAVASADLYAASIRRAVQDRRLRAVAGRTIERDLRVVVALECKQPVHGRERLIERNLRGPIRR